MDRNRVEFDDEQLLRPSKIPMKIGKVSKEWVDQHVFLLLGESRYRFIVEF